MLAFLISCLFALAGTLPSPTADLELDPDRFESRITDDGLTKAEVAGVVDASADAVLLVLGDCARAAEWFPGLQDTRQHVRDETTLCSGRTGLTGPTWTVQTDVVEDEDVWVVPFLGLASDGVRQLYGGFHLSPWAEDPSRTVVVLEVWVELDHAPKTATVRRARRLLEDALAGLEDQARGQDIRESGAGVRLGRARDRSGPLPRPPRAPAPRG